MQSRVEVGLPSNPQTHISTVGQETAISSVRKVFPCDHHSKSNSPSLTKQKENPLLVEWEELLGCLSQTDSPSQEEDKLGNCSSSHNGVINKLHSPQPLSFVDDDILNSPASANDESNCFGYDQILDSPNDFTHTPTKDTCKQYFTEDDILNFPGSVIDAPVEAEGTEYIVDDEILHSPDDSSPASSENVFTHSFVDIDVLNSPVRVNQSTGVDAVSNFEIEIHPNCDSLGEDEINEKNKTKHGILDSISHNSKNPTTFQRTLRASRPSSDLTTSSCRKKETAVNTLQKGTWLNGKKGLVKIGRQNKRKFNDATELKKFGTVYCKQESANSSPMWTKRGAEMKVSNARGDVREAQAVFTRKVYNYSNCPSLPIVSRDPPYTIVQRDHKRPVPTYRNGKSFVSAVSNDFQSSNSKGYFPAEQPEFNGKQPRKLINLMSIHCPHEGVQRRNSSDRLDISRSRRIPLYFEDVDPIGDDRIANDGIATWFHEKRHVSCANDLVVSSDASAVDRLQRVPSRRRTWPRYFEEPIASGFDVEKPSSSYIRVNRPDHVCVDELNAGYLHLDKPAEPFVEMTPQRASATPSALPERCMPSPLFGCDPVPDNYTVDDLETIHFQIEKRSNSLKSCGNLTTLPFQLAKTEVEDISLPPTRRTLSLSSVSQTNIQEFPVSQLRAVKRLVTGSDYQELRSDVDESQSQVRREDGLKEANIFTSHQTKRLKEDKRKNILKNALLRREALIEASKWKANVPHGEGNIVHERQNMTKHITTPFETASVHTKSLSVISSPQPQSQSHHGHLQQSPQQPIQFNCYDYHHVSCDVGSREVIGLSSSTSLSPIKFNSQSNIVHSPHNPSLPSDTTSSFHSRIRNYSPNRTNSSHHTTYQLHPVPFPKQGGEVRDRDQTFLPNGLSSNHISNSSQQTPNTPRLLADIDQGIASFVTASQQIMGSLHSLKQLMNSRTT